MPVITEPKLCLFCGGNSCFLCATTAVKDNTCAERRERQSLVKDSPEKIIAEDACRWCLRRPGDFRVRACILCPPDHGGPLRCINCREREARTAYDLCYPCYRLLPRSTLDRLFRRRPAPMRDFEREAPLPDEPVRALPGQKEKLHALIERASRRQALFHPDDAVEPERLEGAFHAFQSEVAAEWGVDMFDPQRPTVKPIRGIEWNEKRRRWRARPTRGHMRVHLGYFDQRWQAVEAVEKWLKKMEGLDRERRAYTLNA